MLASLGRIVVRDQGYFALSMRLLLKVRIARGDDC